MGNEKSIVERYGECLLMAAGIAAALLVRFSLRGFVSGDFVDFLSDWYDFVSHQGAWRALGEEFTNYTPMFSYLLIVVVKLLPWLPKLFAIKLISVVFDFICAFFVYRIVRIRYPQGMVPAFACLAMLFAPTVVMNGSLWGQSDIVYTTGLVACIYYLLTKREIAAFTAFGLAVSFKLQAIFLAPLLLILLLKKEVSWRSFLIIPAVYMISVLPAWLAGRPLSALLTIYFNQAGFYRELARNVANMYQWLPNEHYDVLYPAGVMLTLAIVIAISLAVYKSKAVVSADVMIQLATTSVLVIPYFLPKMHDRYFFAADVISIVFAFFFPRQFFVPIIIGTVSLLSYFPFLFDTEVVPLSQLAIVQAGVIAWMFFQFRVMLRKFV